MNISVIIPVREGSDTLPHCLASLKRSDFRHFEVIVVDDCSREDCSETVRSFGFRGTRLNQPSGAWHARNKGAQLASGDILVFTDCDMIIPPDALGRIHSHFSRNRYAAVSGICGPSTKGSNLVTRYKNLWMYYSYSQSPENFDWFITGLGAIRREVFFGVKGFDPSFQVKTGGGDLEFGRRLREAGQEILLDKGLKLKHLKRYTFWGLLRNDYSRSKGWFQLAARKKMIPQVVRSLRIANIYPAFIVSVPVSLLFLLSLALSPFFRFTFFSVVFLAVVYLGINHRLFQFLRREAGTGFLLKAIPLSFLDHMVSGFGVMMECIGCLGWLAKRGFQKLKFRAVSRKDVLRISGRGNLQAGP